MSSTERQMELFHAALDVPAPERSAFLDRSCVGQPTLRAELERLLAGHERAPQGFLPGERGIEPGETVAGFQIVAHLGEGGMGLVYAARESFPERDLALKVARPGRVSERVLRRFRHEVQALSELRHPGIAQVYSAGTAVIAGREQPFLAMELVDGLPLLEYAERNGLDRAARIELVARVCDAVHHAHQRGIIHRDLKPQNVLVVDEPDGGIGQPKLLDFGIARLGGDSEYERVTLTGELIGTLAYMSPEQLDGVADVRTDVYAIGVMLYQLLTDQAPFSLDQLPFGEAIRCIRDDEAPAASSLEPGLRGDLDTICARALDKDAARRYQSATALADDLRKHLSGDAIAARSDSAIYVLRKGLRRHRAVAGVLGAIVLAITAVAVVSTTQSRANRRLSLELADQLAFADVERGRREALDGNLPEAEALLWNAFLRSPSSDHVLGALWEAQVRAPYARTWRTWSDPVDAEGAADGERLYDILDLAIHPAGEVFAYAGTSGVISIVDIEGAGEERTIDVGAWVWGLEYSPDGSLLAACTADGEVRLFDSAGEALRRFTVSDEAASALAFASDELLVVGSSEGSVEVFDASTGQRRGALQAGPGRIRSLTFSADRARLAVAGAGGRVWIFDRLAPRPVWSEEIGTAEMIAAAFSPSGRYFAFGGVAGEVHLHDLSTDERLASLPAQNGFVHDLAFHRSEDGLRLFAAGWKVLSWSVPDLEPRPPLGVPGQRIELDVQRGRLITASPRRVRLWDVSGRGRERLFGHRGEVRCELSADGARLATGDGDGVVRIFDVASAKLLNARDLGAGSIRSLSFDPDAGRLAVGDSAGWLTVLDAATGEPLLRRPDHEDATSCSTAFGPRADGEADILLADTVLDGIVRVASADTGETLLEVAADRPVGAGQHQALGVAFHPAGDRFATTGRLEDQVRLWSTAGDLLWERRVHSPWALAFASDGERLAVSSWAPGVVVFDVSTGDEVARLEDHHAVVWDVAFSPDRPDLLASCSYDGTLKLWNVVTGRRLATLHDHHPWGTNSVALGPGAVLASSGRGGVVLRDLAYHDHHVAGNLAYETALRAGEPAAGLDLGGAEAWAASVLDRAWPRFSW